MKTIPFFLLLNLVTFLFCTSSFASQESFIHTPQLEFLDSVEQARDRVQKYFDFQSQRWNLDINKSSLPYRNNIAFYKLSKRHGVYLRLLRNKKKYQRAQKVIAEVMKSAREVYPKTFASLPDPQPVILNTKDLDYTASALNYDINNSGKVPFVFILGLAFFDMPYESQLAITAHELGHFFHKPHMRFAKAYIQNQGPFIHADEISHDETVGHLLNEIINFHKLVGDAYIPQYHSIPNKSSLLGKITLSVLEKSGCSRFVEQVIKEFENSPVRKKPENILLWDMNALPKAELVKFSGKIESALQETQPCYAKSSHSSDSFEDIMKTIDLTEELKTAILSILYAVAQPQDYENSLIYLHALHLILRQALSSKYDFIEGMNIRYYSQEDFADEFMASLLKHKGLDLKSTTRPFWELFTSKEVMDMCSIQYVEKGLEPPYGSLSMEHHSPCWRYYRIIKFSQKFQKIPGLY